ncbi:Cdc6/Cdc18 family protein [Halorientalis salina]|uniref:Cdc6/Cdc18 family protein n=1 Tax=Halorientalis salina TaxID=2932266 RepID=UPI0010AD0B1D|nr:AAA family ATPase [Halorientalis salina]
MDLKSRIRRRRRTGTTATLVLDYEAISPIAHVSEPTGRGPVLERLLDYLDPVFDGDLPPNAYVWGPIGAGKSAVVTALWANLAGQLSESQSVIHTTTRSQTTNAPQFVYVDSREASSTFAQYRAILDAISDESVPEKGIGTDTLETRLTNSLRAGGASVLVAVDHVGEPETPDLATVADRLDSLGASLTWVAVGRTNPETLAVDLPPERIELPAYRRHDLVDILTSRASEGLAERALQHEQTRDIADWAEGNAHDAFAALFGAADRAARKGRSRIHSEDITAGMMDVPRPCSSLGRVMALPQNRQLVLRTFVDLDEHARESVERTTEAIADAASVDLTPGTVKRFLYELAETGIIERVQRETGDDSHGRPPSRVEPRFPITVFRRLYDIRTE